MTGPRNKLTLADIEAEIAAEYYCSGAGAFSNNPLSVEHRGALKLITLCVLILHNGHKVIGINHGPVDPAEFSAEDGCFYAREDAIKKLWEPLGFRLRDRLSSAKPIGDEPPDMSKTLSFADSVADLNGTPRPSSSIDDTPSISAASLLHDIPLPISRAAGKLDPMPEPEEPPRVITPTIGRKVWFYPGPSRVLARRSPDPLDATIVFVWHNRLVNLLVVDHDGKSHPINSVHLDQPGDKIAPSERAEWMPYQVMQAGAA